MTNPFSPGSRPRLDPAPPKTCSSGFSTTPERGGPPPVRAGARVGLGVNALDAQKRSSFWSEVALSNIVGPRPHTTPPPCRASRGLLGTGTLVAGRPRGGALDSVKIITFEAVLGLFWERDSHLLSLTQSNFTQLRGDPRGGGTPPGYFLSTLYNLPSRLNCLDAILAPDFTKINFLGSN